GLTIDSLVSADIVLADGTMVTASESQHPDLFWAIRGGGGNFGVVTSFEFEAHPVSDVIAGPMLWHLDRAAEVMRFYREFVPAAPTDMNGFLAFMTVPPAPPFPDSLHGKPMCAIVFCHTGSEEAAARDLAPARSLGPALDGVAPMPYPMLQSAFDALYPPGLQMYWRADFMRGLPDDAIEAHVEHAAELPTPLSTMHLYPVDGAVHQVAPDATAFRFRDAMFSQVIVGIDPDPANAQRITDWTRRYHDSLHRFGAGGAYVNFLMDEGEARVADTYGENYARLCSIKRKYDPDNVFHVNQNIRPEKLCPD
ncbi:MAG: FAD-binding oxidoreductase, partial [Polyangiaceae bacterium]|nr:FAD-binding oxidoreductase [Polyangiaceae bacterium]